MKEFLLYMPHSGGRTKPFLPIRSSPRSPPRRLQCFGEEGGRARRGPWERDSIFRISCRSFLVFLVPLW